MLFNNFQMPLRLCCEPQYLRHYINYGKELTGLKRNNVLFFTEEHRPEWIKTIIESKDEENFATSLHQMLKNNSMDTEHFVNQTQIIEMRASVAVHTYLRRMIQPPVHRHVQDRFTLSKPHEKIFNMLATLMNISQIAVTNEGIVQIALCDRILSSAWKRDCFFRTSILIKIDKILNVK